MAMSNRTDDDQPLAETRGAIRAEFDWTERTPSTAVIETIAIATNQEPTGLKPLYETIDPDALDMLICPTNTPSPNVNTTVTFVHVGHEITVQRTGTVVVRPEAARTDTL